MLIADIILKKLIEYALKEIEPAFNDKKEITRFEEKVLPDYLERAANDNFYLKTFLHRSEPTQLYNIYQPVRLKEINTNRLFNDKISELFYKSNYISIIGKAGSGKSILINHFLLQCIDCNYAIPVKIYLRHVKDTNFEIENEIAKSIYNKNISLEMIRTLLIKGRFLLLFDGYDELSIESHKFFNDSFVDFLSRYYKNKFILTSRPYAGSDNLPKFNIFSIQNFTKKDIESYIKKQLKDKVAANNIIEQTRIHDDSYVKSFLTNPLLLSIYVLTSRTTTTIPTKQHYFYRKVIDVLFEEHDALSKSGHARDLVSGLNQEEIERILQFFSLFSYFSQRISFSKPYFIKNIKKIKDLNKKNTTGTSISLFDSKKLLYDLKVSVSLLVDNENELSFIHRSIQEFFVVSLIYNLDRYDTKKLMYNKILKRIRNRNSYEVHALLLLFEEIDKTNYYKCLLRPALKNIQNRIYDQDDIQYFRLMKFVFKKFFIRYDSNINRYDNFFQLNHDMIFPVEHLESFTNLTENLKQILNSKTVTSELSQLRRKNYTSITRVLLNNKKVNILLGLLLDEIIDYLKIVNKYISDSESFSRDIVEIL